MSVPPQAANACSSASRADARATARCSAARLMSAASSPCTARATAAMASWTCARAPAVASPSCSKAACRASWLALSCSATAASYVLASSTAFSHAATKRAAAVAAASRSSQVDVASVGDGTHATAICTEAVTTDRGPVKHEPSPAGPLDACDVASAARINAPHSPGNNGHKRASCSSSANRTAWEARKLRTAVARCDVSRATSIAR